MPQDVEHPVGRCPPDHKLFVAVPLVGREACRARESQPGNPPRSQALWGPGSISKRPAGDLVACPDSALDDGSSHCLASSCRQQGFLEGLRGPRKGGTTRPRGPFLFSHLRWPTTFCGTSLWLGSPHWLRRWQWRMRRRLRERCCGCSPTLGKKSSPPHCCRRTKGTLHGVVVGRQFRSHLQWASLGGSEAPRGLTLTFCISMGARISLNHRGSPLEQPRVTSCQE